MLDFSCDAIVKKIYNFNAESMVSFYNKVICFECTQQQGYYLGNPLVCDDYEHDYMFLSVFLKNHSLPWQKKNNYSFNNADLMGPSSACSMHR
jgi:hypothetical protein